MTTPPLLARLIASSHGFADALAKAGVDGNLVIRMSRKDGEALQQALDPHVMVKTLDGKRSLKLGPFIFTWEP